jgi:hypothetical protein
MSKLAEIALGTVVIIVFMAVMGFVAEHLGRSQQINVGGLCPVSNGTASFCIVKGGKPYYFAIEGWVKPNSTMMERYLKFFEYGLGGGWGGGYRSYGGGLLLFLKVRTNLKWKWLISEVECRVGELYTRCFLGSIDHAIKVNNDTYLVPYVLDRDFWELFKYVKDYYMNASDVRLYFEVDNLLGLKPGEVIEIGKMSLVCERRALGYEIGIYVVYPRPEFSITVKDVKYLGKHGVKIKYIGKHGKDVPQYYVLNVSLGLRDVGMAVYYTFDKFGRKAGICGELVPLYVLSILEYPPRDTYVVEKLNKTHYVVAIPVTERARGRCALNGGGFKDVWKEPQHKYIGSYASSGDTVWFSIELDSDYVVDGTVTFVTPWEQVLKVRIPSE